MKNILRLALLLLPMGLLAQAPQVPMNGNIGANFNGPLINSPAVIFTSDADHTMIFPEMSGDGGTLILTSSVTLTATRNLIVPATGNFNWVIRNKTTGGQTITVKVTGGTGVSIANGATANIMCDSVNCYAPTAGTITAVSGTAPVVATPSGSTVNISLVPGSLIATSVAGVDPTGATESTTGLNNAFASAAAGIKSVYLPCGTYTVGALSTNGIEVYGNGDCTLIKEIHNLGTACTNNVLTVTGDGSFIHDLQIQALTADGATIGTVTRIHDANHVVVSHLHVITDNGAIGLLRVAGTGCSASNVSDIQIVHSTLTQTGTATGSEGIGLMDVTGAIIANNTISVIDDSISLHGDLPVVSGPLGLNSHVIITDNHLLSSTRCIQMEGTNSDVDAGGGMCINTNTTGGNSLIEIQNPGTTPTAAATSSKVHIHDIVIDPGSSSGQVTGVLVATGQDIDIDNLQMTDTNSTHILEGIVVSPYPLVSGVQLPLSGVRLHGNSIRNPYDGIAISSSVSLIPSDVTMDANEIYNASHIYWQSSALPTAAYNWKFSGNIADNPYAFDWTNGTASVVVNDNNDNAWNFRPGIFPPTTLNETWIKGQIVWQTTPAEAGTAGATYVQNGWICTVSATTGNPGTWLPLNVPDVAFGNWASLNYPTYVSPSFVKMTGAGTFALDTNTYLTSTGVSGMTQYGFPVAATATSITSSIQPGSWTSGHTFVPVYQPAGSAIAPTVVDANTLNVNSALTASNVNCTASDTCPNDNVWQSLWTTASQLQLATGHPLGSGDSTMTVVTLAGMPNTGHAVTTSEEEIGFTYVSSSGGNSTYNITRGHHNTTPAAVTVAQGNMSGVVSETAACSACAVVWQLGNGGESSNGEQLNAGLRPNVNGSYIYADQNLSVGSTGYIVLGALTSGAPGLAVSGIAGSYGHVIAQPAADTSTDGYLAHADWNTFNGKLSSLSGALLATGATTGATSQAQSFTDGVIPSNLTVGYVPYAESSDKKLVNSPLYTDGTNVGLGTTTPNTALSLGGAANQTDLATYANSDQTNFAFYAAQNFPTSNAYTRTLDINAGGGNASSIIRFLNQRVGTGPAVEAMRIDMSGNVSIGDTTATAMFNVGTANQFQVNSSGVSSAGAGSTDYSTASSAQEAHCLADGTGCPAAGSSVSLGGALSCSNLTLGTGAGTGASCTSVTGLDSNFTVSIETGSSPLPYSYLVDIFAITFTTSRGHNTACTYSPANLSAAGLYGSTSPWMIDSTSPTETSMQPGSTGLTGSTTYDWNVVCP